MRIALCLAVALFSSAPRAAVAAGGAIADEYREGRHFGFGLVGAGPAVTGGIYVEGWPVQYVSIGGGWGWFFMVNQTLWAEVKVMPVRGEWTPMLGGGIAGELISEASKGDDGAPGSYLWREEGDKLYRAYPFVRLGAQRVRETGFTAQVGLLLVFDGPDGVPMIPWPDLRVGWHF